MPSSYQVVLWKQETFVVLRPLQIEFFRNLLEEELNGKLNNAIAVLDRGGAEIIIYLANHSIGILPEGESQIAGVWK
jgi:hypothetical protein